MCPLANRNPAKGVERARGCAEAACGTPRPLRLPPDPTLPSAPRPRPPQDFNLQLLDPATRSHAEGLKADAAAFLDASERLQTLVGGMLDRLAVDRARVDAAKLRAVGLRHRARAEQEAAASERAAAATRVREARAELARLDAELEGLLRARAAQEATLARLGDWGGGE